MAISKKEPPGEATPNGPAQTEKHTQPGCMVIVPRSPTKRKRYIAMTITSNEFHAVFALSKTKMFDVDYYTLGSNDAPYFATSADEFNRPKSDYRQCGQAQHDICKNFPTAMRFFKKWDSEHLHKLTDEKYHEMVSDLETLFNKYPHIVEQKKGNCPLYDFSFSDVKDFSMTVYR